MAENDLIYFDIAAVIIMFVALTSFAFRLKARTPANRMYLSALVLVALNACASLACDLCGMGPGLTGTEATCPTAIRELALLVYYALKELIPPTYLVLIATVSDTSHRLNDSRLTRILLWGPLLVVEALILTNPLHHFVFSYQDGILTRSVGSWAMHISAAYYSVIGFSWLIRWRRVLSEDEFSTLTMIYPLTFALLAIQYQLPHLHIETFTVSTAMLLVSAFVIRPERQMDSLVNAASLQAYRDLTQRAFITGRPLCLVYLEVVGMERLRALIGQDELQTVIGGVTHMLGSVLEPGDVLFYLRNGLFCISPVNLDADHALAVAQRMNDEGRERAKRTPEGPDAISMRSCVVRIPQDVDSADTLTSFVRHFSNLVPHPIVTTFDRLSKRDDFELTMSLSTLIGNAIRDRSFDVYYQPIYCVADGAFHSSEALVRLHDPTFGFVSPALFIPEAERSGAIIEIGHILLDKICAFLESIDFERTGLSYVEVNLSTEQCVRPQLAGEVLSLIDAHGIDAWHMNLEITETSATFSQKTVETNVRTLATAGLTFSLDDYGTGYSNIKRALDLPFDLIKLDKAFTDRLDEEQGRIATKRSIQMMHEIGKQVLVEGVETTEQAKALAEMGADYLQGYLFSRPLPERDYLAFLDKHPSVGI